MYRIQKIIIYEICAYLKFLVQANRRLNLCLPAESRFFSFDRPSFEKL